MLTSKVHVYNIVCTVYISQSWKLERKKLSIANQTLAMILDLLSIMSKDGISLYSGFNVTRIYPELEIKEKKLSIANQTLAMILDLLSFMSKDGVSLYTRFNVTRIYPVIVTLHVRWFSLNETGFP